MLNTLQEWAHDWAIPPEALDDLYARQMQLAEPEVITQPDGSEAYTQSLVRLACHTTPFKTFRNNVGVLPNPAGRPVRFGLANDTAALNDVIKSGDLIGWYSQIVTEAWARAMIGRKVAIFVSIETKDADWVPALSGDKFEHEQAQRRWRDMVQAAGGIACFSTGGLPEVPGAK